MAVVHTIEVANIHCSSCENEVQHIVSEVDQQARATCHGDTVTIATDGFALDLKEIVLALSAKGFEIRKVDGLPIVPSEGEWLFRRIAQLFRRNWEAHPTITRPKGSKAQAEVEHLQICGQCQEDEHDGSQHSQPDHASHDNESQRFRAVYSITGMTCSSCAQSVSASIRSTVPEVLDVAVDVISGAAWVILPSKTMASKVSQAISDAGFDPLLTEILPVSDDASRIIVRASIGGMTCGSCAATVKTATSALPYVTAATVDSVTGSAEFTITDPSKAPELKTCVEDLGYTYEQVGELTNATNTKDKARTINLKVSGIYCDRCPERVMHTLEGYGEVVEIVDPITRESPYIKFTYIPSPPKFTIRTILASLRTQNPVLTFSIVQPKTLEELAVEHLNKEDSAIVRRAILTAACAVPALILMIAMPLSMEANNVVMLCLATPVYVFAADIFHKKAITEVKGLFTGRTPGQTILWRMFHFGSMNLLMSLGTSISFWASVYLQVTGQPETYFDSVIFLMLFLLIGRFLDVKSKVQTSVEVSNMWKLRPDTAELYYDNSMDTVALDEIETGDIVAVLPGHKCAVDGVIIRGETGMNESMLTGEAMPVPKAAGDQVFAGSVNSGDQTLIVKVGAVNNGTLLDNIVESVRQAQFKRAPIERFADTVTSIFVPIIIYLSLTVWLLWYIVGEAGLLPHESPRSWGIWSMNFAIATFVIACPCGIGLAAPTAMYVGNGVAARYGILVRGGGVAFQEGSHVDVICFDKTGTLTKGGDIKIVDVWCNDNAKKDTYLRLASALEVESVHPLAKAVQNFAPAQTSAKIEADITQVATNGRGVKATISVGDHAGSKALLGNERLIVEAGINIPDTVKTQISQYKSQGKSVIIMAVDEEVVLVLGAADEIRPEAKETVSALQAAGIACYMLSGDNLETAQAVAKEVGIFPDNVLAEVLPQEKADRVSYLQKTANTVRQSYGRAIVAMIGDGVNDAPALAASDVGIALGRGADIALSSSQFVLLREDLLSLPVLFQLSRAVMHRVKFNFFWAAVYNLVAIPIAAGALYPWSHARLDPVWASLTMALSSVSVMTSSLMLKRFKAKSINYH